MKKIFQAIAFAALTITAQNVFAQNARETNVEFMKGSQNAIIADYDLPKDIVEGALKEYFDKANIGKRKSEKGFMAYKGVTWNEISTDKMDVYAKVTGNDSKSSVTLLVSNGYDNFITSAKDADKVQKAQNFLNNFVNSAKAYQLRLAIEAQEEVVKKADKAVTEITNDGNDLQKDKEKIEKKIAENQTEQEKRKTTLASEKQKLEDLKKQL